MSLVTNGLGEVVVDQAAIQAEVARLGTEISAEYTGKRLHLIGVLKGSAIFLADLMRALTIPVTVDFISIVPYGEVTVSGVVRIRKDLDESIEAKDVLVVEGSARAGLPCRTSCEIFGRAIRLRSRSAPSSPSSESAPPTSALISSAARSPTFSWSATASTRTSVIATCPMSRGSPPDEGKGGRRRWKPSRSAIQPDPGYAWVPGHWMCMGPGLGQTH
jgi:hypothetical protein